MKKSFHLDKPSAMLLGVCSGLARYFGVDATLVRLAVVALTLLGGFPWTCIAYAAVAWVARPAAGTQSAGTSDHRPSPTRDHRHKDMRDVDRRLADIESYMANSNSRLAREIDELR